MQEAKRVSVFLELYGQQFEHLSGLEAEPIRFRIGAWGNSAGAPQLSPRASHASTWDPYREAAQWRAFARIIGMARGKFHSERFCREGLGEDGL